MILLIVYICFNLIFIFHINLFFCFYCLTLIFDLLLSIYWSLSIWTYKPKFLLFNFLLIFFLILKIFFLLFSFFKYSSVLFQLFSLSGDDWSFISFFNISRPFSYKVPFLCYLFWEITLLDLPFYWFGLQICSPYFFGPHVDIFGNIIFPKIHSCALIVLKKKKRKKRNQFFWYDHNTFWISLKIPIRKF